MQNTTKEIVCVSFDTVGFSMNRILKVMQPFQFQCYDVNVAPQI